MDSQVAHSQAMATFISRIILGAMQSPAPAVHTALLLVETTSIRVTYARAITQPAVGAPYSLQTVHGGCTCHLPVWEDVS